MQVLLFLKKVRKMVYFSNVFYSFLIKGLSYGISFLFFPLLLGVLNTSDYSVFLVLNSIIGWFALLDIGLSNGLRNKLTAALAQEDFHYAQKLVSTAYVSIFTYSFVILLVFIGVNKFINWPVILNANYHSREELSSLSFLLFLSFCLRFVLNIMSTVLTSMHKQYYSPLFDLISQVISFLVTCIVIFLFEKTSLQSVLLVVSFVPIIVLLFFNIYFFSGKFSNIRPVINLFKWNIVKDIMGIGFKFFVLQIITLIIFQSNVLIIAHTSGDIAVVNYSIGTRYIETVGFVFAIVVAPIWSLATAAYIEEDFKWLKEKRTFLIKVSTCILGLGIILVLFSNYFFKFWLGDGKIGISKVSLFLILGFVSARNYYQSYGYMLNGFGKLNMQLIITSIVAVIYMPIAIFFGNIYGLNGVLFTLLMSQVINVIWSHLQFEKIVNRSASGIWNR